MAFEHDNRHVVLLHSGTGKAAGGLVNGIQDRRGCGAPIRDGHTEGTLAAVELPVGISGFGNAVGHEQQQITRRELQIPQVPMTFRGAQSDGPVEPSSSTVPLLRTHQPGMPAPQ